MKRASDILAGRTGAKLRESCMSLNIWNSLIIHRNLNRVVLKTVKVDLLRIRARASFIANDEELSTDGKRKQ